MAITVEAGAPGSIVVDEDEDEDEDEEVLPGAVVGECAICYKEYLVGGATSVKLPCSHTHTFHRKCLDRWTAVNRTCPCFRAPVPEEQEYWDEVMRTVATTRSRSMMSTTSPARRMAPRRCPTAVARKKSGPLLLRLGAEHQCSNFCSCLYVSVFLR